MYKVTFGQYDLTELEDSVVTFDVDKWVPHPEYNSNLENDLMLLRLDKPVEYNDYIAPACILPNVRNVVDYASSKTCFNIGYGLGKRFILLYT